MLLFHHENSSCATTTATAILKLEFLHLSHCRGDIAINFRGVVSTSSYPQAEILNNYHKQKYRTVNEIFHIFKFNFHEKK